MATAILRQISDDRYEACDGHVMQREEGVTPGGNQMGGRWVLRGPGGLFIDIDQYRSDLSERHGFVLGSVADSALPHPIS